MAQISHREQLLQGAIECLRTKGYARTTARDIAAAAKHDRNSLINALKAHKEDVGKTQALAGVLFQGPRLADEALHKGLPTPVQHFAIEGRDYAVVAAPIPGNFADRTSGVLILSSVSDELARAREPGRTVILFGLLAIIVFGVCYAIIAGRLVMYAATDNTTVRRAYSADAVATARPDILDRNGEILATDVRMPSLFAEPHRIIDVDEAVELLAEIVPDIDVAEIRERLSSKRRSAWLKREITPKQRADIYRLGLPGLGFMQESKRIYPNGNAVSHVVGHVNVDNQGIAGIERWLDSRGLAELHMAGLTTDRLDTPVELSIDLRAQHALRDELIKARIKFKAKGVAGLVTDARTGEVVAMVSLPDYDSNNPREALDRDRINRLTVGVYEMGSTFKSLTIAMALDSGRIGLKDSFDARAPLVYGKHTVHDFHPQNRILTVPEIFTYSSNIGTARMALKLGVEYHKSFLRKLGQLDRLRTEVPESTDPLVPRNWGELNTVTIAFGHGLSVAPLQAMMAVGALVNGGNLIPPTFRKRTEQEALTYATRVIKPETSEKMRYLMRLNVEKGTATKADVPGYYVGGKTGTAEKVEGGRYSATKRLNSFLAAFPMDYLYLYDNT